MIISSLKIKKLLLFVLVVFGNSLFKIKTEIFEKMLKACLLLLLIIETKGQPVKRIYNGTYDLNVPYYVQIAEVGYFGLEFICGGVIIAKDLILTAAHCLEDIEKEYLRVISGGKLRKLSEQPHKIDYILAHEKYDNETFENDIALIKLQQGIKFNSESMPIKIRFSPLRENELLKISGMGKFDERSGSSQVLQSTIVPVVAREHCQKKYYPDLKNERIYENMFCAGSEENHVCVGDSGGPAVDLIDDEANELVGIVSWGQPRTCSNGPDVYTNVIKYFEWIEKNTNYDVRGFDESFSTYNLTNFLDFE